MSDTEIIRSDPAGALSVRSVLDQLQQVQELMRAAMVRDVDYGVIPGTKGKPTLLKPGAEKLLMLFRLAPEYAITRRELAGEHVEYEVLCRLTHIPSGNFVGSGVGLCSSMEAKYRWRGGAFACPNCGATAIIKGKEMYGGGWICWGKKGGCGEKFPDDQFSGAPERMENPDLADIYNTVIKIAKKRALNDATLTATGASAIFDTDLDDHAHDDDRSHVSDNFREPDDAPPKKPAADSATRFWSQVRVKKIDKATATKVFEECGRDADKALKRLEEQALGAVTV